MSEQLGLLDDPKEPANNGIVIPVSEPRTQNPRARLYRDRVIAGTMTMEQFARALERHDQGYQGPPE